MAAIFRGATIMTRHEPASAFDTALDADIRTLTILNVSGHSSLAWSPKNDDMMRELIAKKLKEGYAFFVIKRRMGGFLPDKRVRVTDLQAAMDARNLSMDDEDFARIIAEGGVQLIRTPAGTGLRDGDAVQSHDPAEIASNRSVAARGMAGG